MGNVYCISDIHNDFDRFQKMLKKIHFRAEDTLYIVGDIFDRGDQPLELYQKIRQSKNMMPILGNHDRWLAEYIRQYLREERVGRYEYNTFLLLKDLGNVELLREIVDWIDSFPNHLCITVEGQNFCLAHGRTYEDPQEKTEEDFIMGEVDFSYLKKGIPDCISVVGHVPTDRIRQWAGNDPEKKNSIWVNKNRTVFCIDCGCGFSDKKCRLGCLRLNDGKEFYVP